MGDELRVLPRLAAGYAWMSDPVMGGDRAREIEEKLFHKSKNVASPTAFLSPSRQPPGVRCDYVPVMIEDVGAVAAADENRAGL